MASRVPGFGVKGDEAVSREAVERKVNEESVRSQQVYVDANILNEAVEDTLRTAHPHHAESVRRLWALNHDSDAAEAYFVDQIKQRTQLHFSELNRPAHNVMEVLNQDESALVTDYAREFNLSFRNAVGHDHALFAARRTIDHRILLSRFPASVRYLDHGGSVAYHVRSGHANAVTVAPFDVDSKDPSRRALTQLLLKKLAGDAAQSDVVRSMATSVLRGEEVYHVRATTQTVNVQAPVSVAVHVYDVPIQDWPLMMERCGVRVHEGCLHFDNRFFEEDSGVIPSTGAYYEIDRGKDRFRMRVGTSPSAWYDHKWSDYMRYGANQIIRTGEGTYSYQIVERRLDTVFYRILRVDSATLRDHDQFYALPDVPMVEVSGFEVVPSEKANSRRVGRQMMRRKYRFPMLLWERMLAYATAEVDRGGLSYEKMMNYYRTVVPRQSINNVTVSGGQSVAMAEVPALVIMAATVAYADVLLMHRTIRAQTDIIQKERTLRQESTIFKAFAVFMSSLVALGRLAMSPLALLSRNVTAAYLSLMKEQLVTWQPEVRLRSLNLALFVDHKQLGFSVRTPTQIDFLNEVSGDIVGKQIDLLRADVSVARDILAKLGDKMDAGVRERLQAEVGTVASDAKASAESATAVGDVTPAEVPAEVGQSWLMRNGKKIRRTVLPPVAMRTLVANRRLAIKEAYDECVEESRAVTATCHRIYRDVVHAGKPNEEIMRRRKEEYFNVDLWLARSGVLVQSVMDPTLREVPYSGVYVPTPDAAGNYLFPVAENDYDGPQSATGEYVSRTHFVLPVAYTGYVLVIDQLKIFNGPAVMDTLKRALELPDSEFSFTVVCHQGPPGCGKTTSVVADGDPDQDVYMAPGRIAVAELRKRLSSKYGTAVQKVRMVCRTLDSFLVNYARLPARAKEGFRKLLIDEYVLARAGKWYAVMALLGMREVHAYGDFRQIAHVPRVQVSAFFVQLQAQILEEEFVSFRNSAAVVASYNFMYDNQIRSAVTRTDGQFIQVRKLSEVKWMKDARLLSMYQATVKFLRQYVAHMDHAPIVSTVHEAQGSDCDQVVLYNDEMRKRDPEDVQYLYNKLAYGCVATSRARVQVVYVKESLEPDLIVKMMGYACDPRRIQAAKELSTMGSSNVTFAA